MPKFASHALLALVVLAVAATLGCRRGGTYPDKPITLIVPLPAGSAPDVNFRMVAEEAKKGLGQEVVVVNRPGGGGSVGNAEVLQAKADGYTIGMSAVAMVTLQPVVNDLPYKGPQDVTPILQVTEAPMVLAVRSESPWRSASDFVAAAKAQPDTLRVGMAERFTVLHLELELLQELAGIRYSIIPFAAGQNVPALLGGTIDAVVAQPTIVLPQVEAAKARVIGVFGNERLESVDVTTLKPQCYYIPQIPYEFLIAPKDTPPEVVQKLHDSFKAAMESSQFQEHAAKTKIRARYVSGPDLARKLEEDFKVYKGAAERLNWKGQGQ